MDDSEDLDSVLFLDDLSSYSPLECTNVPSSVYAHGDPNDDNLLVLVDT